MTGISTLFTSYSLLSGKDKVTIADGTCATIAGKGSVRLNGHLALPSTLHVPSLSINLLSVNSLTKSLNCSVTFFPSHCIFQDLQTQQTIGSGREVDGLYHFEPGVIIAF